MLQRITVVVALHYPHDTCRRRPPYARAAIAITQPIGSVLVEIALAPSSATYISNSVFRPYGHPWLSGHALLDLDCDCIGTC